MSISLQHVVVQEAEVLLHIRKVAGLNLVSETGYRKIGLYKSVAFNDAPTR
jgi:hypothetical protein